MVKAKKVLCLVLSVVMLFSCLMISSSAAVGDGKSIGLRLEADKTTVNPGDTITYTLYIDLADPSTTLSNFILFFSYNNTQLVTPTKETLERTWLNDFAGYYKDASIVTVKNLHNSLKAQYTTEEAALYNAAFQIQGTVDTAKGTAADGMAITDSATAQMTFKMVVADGVAPGTTISMGVTPAGFLLKTRGAMFAYANGTSTPSKYTVTDIDFTDAIATTATASDEKAPVLTKAHSQVKMTATSATTVADAFQFRVISSISSDDWNTYFANTGKDGATENVITSVGFVAYKGTAFDLEAAKAVAQAGKDSGDYAYADTDYICHEDGGVATFGCRINYSAKPENDPTYIAFAKYKDASGADQIVFYAAAETSPLATNYTGIVADYLATFPYAG